MDWSFVNLQAHLPKRQKLHYSEESLRSLRKLYEYADPPDYSTPVGHLRHHNAVFHVLVVALLCDRSDLLQTVQFSSIRE
jgi:hypothetical protein